MDKHNQRKHRQKFKPHVNLGRYKNKLSAYRIENSKIQNKKYRRLNKQEICKSVLLKLFFIQLKFKLQL